MAARLFAHAASQTQVEVVVQTSADLHLVDSGEKLDSSRWWKMSAAGWVAVVAISAAVARRIEHCWTVAVGKVDPLVWF